MAALILLVLTAPTLIFLVTKWGREDSRRDQSRREDAYLSAYWDEEEQRRRASAEHTRHRSGPAKEPDPPAVSPPKPRSIFRWLRRK